MEKPLIAFKLEYLCETGWGAISNFITKFSEKIPMENSNVEIVSSIRLDMERSYDNVFLAKKIDQNSSRFKKIAKPENMYAADGKYDYIFFISIEFKQLTDVVDLQNLYLICDACRQYRIIALISGNQREYHKTSHFFTF